MVATRVFVGGTPHGTNPRDLELFFIANGKLIEVTLEKKIAFVTFENKSDAVVAIAKLNGEKLLGKPVTVALARRSFRTDFRLIVKNLSPRTNWRDLKDHMKQVGRVTYAHVHRGERYQGIVDFAFYSGMMGAMERLDNTELCGNRIQLVEHKRSKINRLLKNERRAFTRCRSRSHSRSSFCLDSWARPKTNSSGANASRGKLKYTSCRNSKTSPSHISSVIRFHADNAYKDQNEFKSEPSCNGSRFQRKTSLKHRFDRREKNMDHNPEC